MDLSAINIELEKISESVKQLDPDKSSREELIKKTTNLTEQFLSQIEELPAFVNSDSLSNPSFSEIITDQGEDIDTILHRLHKSVVTPGLNPASGGHLGYIPGGGLFPSALGDFIAAITNKYAGIFFAGPGAVQMENFLVSWMASIFNYPASAAGHLASGGSIANLTAIVTARDAMGLKANQFPKACIYLTQQVHHCINKAINISGLAEAVIRNVKMDGKYRMSPDHLKDLIISDKKSGRIPFLVVASAGTTDTGSVDPLDKIGEIANKHNLWFHVDAAYGGFFQLLDQMKSIFKGIELSDSLVVDPHKGLFLPYGIGAVIVKNAEALHHSHQYQANYMQDALNSDQLSPAEVSPELTKHFRGLRMWLPLKLFGLKVFKDALWEKILLARYFYEKVKEWDDFQVGPYPELSVVIYRYQRGNSDSENNDLNLKLVRLVQNDGRVFISSTTIYNKVWLRLAVLSFRTHKKTIDVLLKVLREKVKEL